jgi:hypothetical protein
MSWSIKRGGHAKVEGRHRIHSLVHSLFIFKLASHTLNSFCASGDMAVNQSVAYATDAGGAAAEYYYPWGLVAEGTTVSGRTPREGMTKR